MSLLNCTSYMPSSLRDLPIIDTCLMGLCAIPIINTRLRTFTLINRRLKTNLHQAIFVRLRPSALFCACAVHQLCNDK